MKLESIVLWLLKWIYKKCVAGFYNFENRLGIDLQTVKFISSCDLDQFLHQCYYFLLASQDQKMKSARFQNWAYSMDRQWCLCRSIPFLSFWSIHTLLGNKKGYVSTKVIKWNGSTMTSLKVHTVPLTKVNFNMAKELSFHAISNLKTLLLRIR